VAGAIPMRTTSGLPVTEQGFSYSTYIEDELKAERERRSTFDSRATGVVATSASMVAIIGAVAAFAHLDTDRLPSKLAYAILIIALVTLLGAAVLGIVAGWNWVYPAPSLRFMGRMTEERWTDQETDARNIVASARIVAIEGLRRGNSTKATLVGAALIVQVGGLAALSAATGMIFWPR
jgi:hypothetical protein